jgi:CBS domain-containing protein
MGEQKVSHVTDKKIMEQFMWNLLRDVQALEQMIEEDWFEEDIVRIGAEQEMCLVDATTFKPSTIAMKVLDTMKDMDWCGTELALFNLETNLNPREFTGSALRDMEKENWDYLKIISEKLKPFNSKLILTGILPTLRKFDLELHNLTPKDRYKALIASINDQKINGNFELNLSGIDELNIKHDSPLLEACNTSFQVHLQVTPKNFAPLYNIAQMLAAPMISVSANSPIVFGRRLWHETRIALFQQSMDTRSSHEHLRERSPRVSFGHQWLDKSILEIYKEDIARFRVLLGDVVDEDSLEKVAQKITPKLRALLIHNSTVYRWNRPCYGISPNGKPHLRIENRVLPAGPSCVDEMANAAFWLGSMVGYSNRYADIRKEINFEDVRDNFDKAAKFGIDTKYTWMKDKKISVPDLVKNEMLEVAREGLVCRKIDKQDIDKYLGIIEERIVKKGMNGARWQLRTFSRLKKDISVDEAITVMTSAIVKNQAENKPIHEWEEPQPDILEFYKPSKLKVEEFMQTDLFTVRKEDIIAFVSQMMDWRKIRYMPVEDKEGKLVGMITSRLLLRHYAQANPKSKKQALVGDVMLKDPMSVSPDTTILKAMEIMREKKIGCLPVVKGDELIGIITEMDFLRITGRLLERLDTEMDSSKKGTE